MKNALPSHLSDIELTEALEQLARSAREATARLVAHLVEFDARRLYLAAGCQSLYAYCTERLHLSEYGAYNRMGAARAVRGFPVVLDMLADGSLTLATARILAPHLTDDNHETLLAEARGRSKRDVEAVIARHFPRPAVPTLIRKLPVRPHAVSLASESARTPPAEEPLATGVGAPDHQVVAPVVGDVLSAAQVPTCSPLTANPPRRTVMALAPDRYQIRFTASAETYQLLREAQELLGHVLPSGDVAAVFDRALASLVTELRKKKTAATTRPRKGRRASEGPPPASEGPPPASEGSRHIPAEVRRAVWERDGGRCAFVTTGGLRCSARKRIEFHHVHPYAVGGEATIGNIELRCRGHNAYEAEQFYRQQAERWGFDSPRGELSGRARRNESTT